MAIEIFRANNERNKSDLPKMPMYFFVVASVRSGANLDDKFVLPLIDGAVNGGDSVFVDFEDDSSFFDLRAVPFSVLTDFRKALLPPPPLDPRLF